MTRHFDVVILGGGPAGSAAARQLAKSAVSVLIIEENPVAEFKIGETIPGIADVYFARAGFANLFKTIPRLRCSGNQSAWGSEELHFRSSLLDPYGGGSHIDRLKFDEALLAEAVSAGARLLRGVHLRAWERRNNGWQITLPPRAGTVNCEAIIDCTGRKAVFARSQEARRVVFDKQIAAITLMDSSSDMDLSTTIEATEIGWWYSAKVPDGKRVVALFSDIDLCIAFGVRSAKGMADLIRATRHISTFLERGGGVEGPPKIVLADTAYLSASAGYGWCAAGDSAMSSDPLASMGIMNAIKAGSDAALLVMADFSGSRAYSDAVAESAMSHIKQRRAYCRMETRWPDSPFWVRRQRKPERSIAEGIARSPNSQ
jgi:flavin-dependent dehydrogenase